MRQPGLIHRVISSVVLDDGMAKGKYTSDGSVPLIKNEEGVPVSGSFNYSSVVGMLIYLSIHTRPEINFSVNFCVGGASKIHT